MRIKALCQSAQLRFSLARHGLQPQYDDELTVICGVFGHPNGFWQRGFRLGDLGINAVFVSSGDIDQQIIDRTRAEGGQIFAEFATLNGDYGDYVANHPEAHPIDESGQPAARATWFMGACH